MRIRSDMRGSVGVQAAPLGVALLGVAGINVDPLAVVSPTRIDVHVFEPAADVAEVHLDGRVLREGRSQYFTEARFTDAADPARLVAIGGTHWSVGPPNPDFVYQDPGEGVDDSPDLPPLYEVFGARRRDDGNLEIPALGPELGGDALHQGPFQVVPEAAATLAARDAVGTDRFWIEHQGTSIITRGAGTPLVTHAEVLRVAEGCVNVRVELRAEGADDRLLSVTICRFRSG
jgi:hypothetical protein